MELVGDPRASDSRRPAISMPVLDSATMVSTSEITVARVAVPSNGAQVSSSDLTFSV